MKKFLVIFALIIISVSITAVYAQSQYEIPSWVKGVAGYWSEGKITDSDFGEALSFLINNEMIKVPKIQELQNEISQLKTENAQLKAKLGSTTGKEVSATNNSKCSGSAKCVSETVTRIVDGDTLYTTNYKIRLSLTNTPEVNESGYSTATTFTSKMCPVGSTILIDQDDLQLYDTYGRLLANVYCDGKLLNSALLYNGYANIMTEYCSTSEFSGEKWAKDFGCGVKPTLPTQSPTKSSTISQSSSKCDPSYPDFCIPTLPPDLDCKDIPQKRFTVLQPDPHRFDGDKDGIGCES
ncbi:thermonuclease family protein [Nitrosarchaeum koreense]|uniref:Excalibur domain protein n=1 Tax=Nitrosarchaeum koreense MY1 TaxID=1001994 RepID=F9CXS8_9ARCH|nr:thermonuclease family protein [Nitrosarchaeum koreense]EGP94044.1 Excalibur domain protein [Nitrosarchaeum koreense MY1]